MKNTVVEAPRHELSTSVRWITSRRNSLNPDKREPQSSSAGKQGIYLPTLEPLKWLLSHWSEERMRKCRELCLCEYTSLWGPLIKTLLKGLWIYEADQQRDAQLEERAQRGVETAVQVEKTAAALSSSASPCLASVSRSGSRRGA
ncbi:uncharacterized protein V6R79_020541 [Siganus canaliculatus]